MKKLFVTAVAAVCAFGMSAQRASDSSEFSFWDGGQSEQKIIVGPRVGLNVSSLSVSNLEMDNDKSKIGFNVGVAVEFPIVRSFYINSGLFYTTKGIKYTTKGIKFENSDLDWSEKDTYNAGYLELPLYASYRLNFAEASQLQINFGPYFAYGVNGKIKEVGTKIDYEENDEGDVSKYEYEYDLFGVADEDSDEEKGGIKRFDCGLGVGLGYTWNRIYLGFNYQFGLVNIADKKEWGNGKIKNSNFSISLGYNF